MRISFTFASVCLISAFIFLSTCSSGPKSGGNSTLQPAVKGIPLDEPLRIAVLAPKLPSNLNKMDNWPKKEDRANKLREIFLEINQDLSNHIGTASQFNRISIVHQSEKPNYRVQLSFEKAICSQDQCEIPFGLKVYNQAQPRGDFEHKYSHLGLLQITDAKLKKAYFWTSVLEDYKAKFPYAKILQNLFLSPDEKG